MSQHLVTPRGARVLKVGGARPLEGSVIDTTGWQTIPTLLAQGLLQEIVELPAVTSTLPEGFPHKEVLEQHGHRSVEAVHFLTDRQLIALPEIGEAAVRDIRAFIAQQRGEKPRSYADDLAMLHEVGHVAFWNSEDLDAPALERPEDYVVLVADRGHVAEAVAALRSHLLDESEQIILHLADPAFDPSFILAELRAPDGTYTLSEPLTLLLERLGLSYPPLAPAVPADGEVPPPAELQHPTSDSEKEAEPVQSGVTSEGVHPKGEQVKTEEKTPSSRGKNTAKPKG